jgi:hypothetical protein
MTLEPRSGRAATSRAARRLLVADLVDFQLVRTS